MRGEEFGEVSLGLHRVKEDFKRNAGGGRGASAGREVLMFMHPHQDPGSTVLNMLETLKALARIPVRGALQESNLEETKACTSFSAAGREREGRSLATGGRRKSCRYG